MSNVIVLDRPLTGVRLATRGEENSRPGDRTGEETEGRQKELEAAMKEGFEAGQKEAEARLKKRLDALKEELEALTKGAAQYEEDLIHQMEKTLPDLILDGIRQVLAGWEPEREWVERIVLEMLQNLKEENGPFTVYLSPKSRLRLLAHHENPESSFPGIEFREDPKLYAGECYIESRFGMTDGRYEAKIQNLGKALW